MREMVNNSFDHLDHGSVRGPCFFVECGYVQADFGFGFESAVVVEELNVRRFTRLVRWQSDFPTLKTLILN